MFLIVYTLYSASENAFKGILTSLPKQGGGEFGKFYSLPALNDPRIGKYAISQFCYYFLFYTSSLYLMFFKNCKL